MWGGQGALVPQGFEHIKENRRRTGQPIIKFIIFKSCSGLSLLVQHTIDGVPTAYFKFIVKLRS